MSYEEEDTCASYEEDTCVSYEEDTCVSYVSYLWLPTLVGKLARKCKVHKPHTRTKSVYASVLGRQSVSKCESKKK
jgi:hypothetical protein